MHSHYIHSVLSLAISSSLVQDALLDPREALRVGTWAWQPLKQLQTPATSLQAWRSSQTKPEQMACDTVEHSSMGPSTLHHLPVPRLHGQAGICLEKAALVGSEVTNAL